MADRTGRLRLAPDEYSDTHFGWSTQTTSKGPAATSVAVPMRQTSGRGARRHHTVSTNEGASSMAKRTRTSGMTDSGTQVSGVNITPTPSQTGPVTTTHSTR